MSLSRFRIIFIVLAVGLGALKAAPDTMPSTRPANADRIPHEKPIAGELRVIDIRELGNFDYDAEKGGGIPSDVLQLSGIHVHVTGFMVPQNEAAGISRFLLVPSLFSCCFGKPPQVQHTMMVEGAPGMRFEFASGPVAVEGILRVQEIRDDGYTTSIFQVKSGEIKSAVSLPPSVLKGHKKYESHVGSVK